ncbi:MAG: transporter [Acidobacteriota bacterium]|nr:transporter [Acidobacteriota bacterium]
MNVLLPLLFAFVAAVGNAMFALGQRRSASAHNGLAFVGASAVVAATLAWLSSPLLGAPEVAQLVRLHGRNILLAGTGLFLTYLGFNLLYSRYGASQYVLYAVLSILTTTVFVGILWLHEPVNAYKLVAIVLATASVVLYSLGQARTS